MVNKFLLREDAPIGEALWKLLDSTMVEAAKGYLAGRRILPLEGPFGFGLKAVPMEDCIGEGTSSATIIGSLMVGSLTIGSLTVGSSKSSSSGSSS
jgi:uncharacterized linocin/CFP29 family protein